jgi:hypothetical protein
MDLPLIHKEAESLIHAYFASNSRPVDLDILNGILTDDVVVDYPSGRFVGRDDYIKHQRGTSRCLLYCFYSSNVSASAPPTFDNVASTSIPVSCLLSCTVSWNFSAQTPLLCCYPISKSGTNRYGSYLPSFKILNTY